MIAASMSAASRADAPVLPPTTAAASEVTSPVTQAAKPNPSSQLNLTLGITVLTFHDAAGQVVATTPTQQQLNTYLLFGSAPRATAKPAGAEESAPGVAMLA